MFNFNSKKLSLFQVFHNIIIVTWEIIRELETMRAMRDIRQDPWTGLGLSPAGKLPVTPEKRIRILETKIHSKNTQTKIFYRKIQRQLSTREGKREHFFDSRKNV